MRVTVDEFIYIRDVRILIDAAMCHDKHLYVIARGDRITRAKDGYAVRKVATAAGLTSEWIKGQQSWCIQKEGC